MRKFWLAFALLLLAIGFARAEMLAPAKPEEVGFSSERLGRMTQYLREQNASGLLAGAVVLIAREGKIAYYETVGMRDPAANAPMNKDAIFRIYSMSKPITSVAVMMLVEEGKILLSDPVAKYLPEFKDVKVGVEIPAGEGGPARLELQPARRAMTVQDLLRHTSGLTYGVFGDSLVKRAYRDAGLGGGDVDNAAFTAQLAKMPLMFQPGSTWEYGYSTDVLGRIVEVVSEKSLYQFEKERILDPLGMVDTAFYVESAKHDRIAEPYPDDRMVVPGAPIFDPRVQRKWEAGGQGMVGTAMDYGRFLQMLLNGGELDGKRYLSPKTITYMTSDHLEPAIARTNAYGPGAGNGFGLGFAVRGQDGVAAVPGTAGDYFWSGAGGTVFWVDPKEKMFVVLMVQSLKLRAQYRFVIRNLVYAAMTR